MNRKVFWTNDKLRKEAQKYKYRGDFKKNRLGAYDKLRKQKRLDEFCSHMEQKRESWDFKKLFDEAKKYPTRISFQKGNPKAYDRARKLKILDDICIHMKYMRKNWTVELIKEEASKYSSKVLFKENNPYVYRKACKLGVLNDMCGHMLPCRIKWSKELIYERAKLYETKKSFAANDPRAYAAAHRLGIIDKVCAHMQKLGSKHFRAIYIILFANDKSFYVGMTDHTKRRQREHTEGSSNQYVKSLIESGSTFEYIVLTDYLNVEKAVEQEEGFRKEFMKKGLVCLNVMPTGGLGGNTIKWTFKQIANAAKQCNTKTEFKERFPGAYDAALNQKVIEQVTSHMEKVIQNWNEDKILHNLKDIESIEDLIKNNRNLYMAAWRRGIHKQVFSQLKYKRKGKYLTSELIKIASTNDTKTDFQKNNPGAFSATHKRKIMQLVWNQSRSIKEANSH